MGNSTWEDLCSRRRFNHQFQGAGARPRLVERRNGLARGVIVRLAADWKLILFGVQWCLNALLSASGYSAYRTVSRSNLVDLFGWEDGDKDLPLAQDTSLSGQSVQPWELRVMAQEAILRRGADGKLRRSSA